MAKRFKRNYSINVRLTAAEYAALLDLAALLGRPRGTVLRAALLAYAVQVASGDYKAPGYDS